MAQGDTEGGLETSTIPLDSAAVLRHADLLIHGSRNQQYGSARESFSKVALVWSMILGIEVRPEQVPLMMAGYKIVRETHTHKDDNIIDAIGYLALTADVRENDVPTVR